MSRQMDQMLDPAQNRDDRHDRDDFDDFLDSNLRDPQFAAAFEDAAQRARIVANLVACRKAQGLKQREVAAHMGVKQPMVSEFEKSGTDSYLSTVQRYARSVGARMVIKIEMPADQQWGLRPRAYASTKDCAEVAPTVVKAPDSDWLLKWAAQAQIKRETVPA